jgi:K+-sensing histidine kinase KdpD
MSMPDEPLDFSLILASSVHDMKNSVGMLLASLEEFIHDTADQLPRENKHLATLQYEASRINGELVQLLSVYRMQGNRLPVHIEENYPSDMLDDQVARNDMLLQMRGVTIEIDCDHDLRWYYDNELVGGVIHNVIVNCARYTREKIKISVSRQEDELCIAVADDGGGYPSDMIENPLVNDDRVDFQTGSTHLGLFFAASVAGMHRQNQRRGRIQLKNNGMLGGGEFRLYLP